MPAHTARDSLEAALAAIAAPDGEGQRAFLTLYPAQARAEADAADLRARNGLVLGPLDGCIVAIKDLFDVAGEPTRSGSRVHADAAPAASTAPIVRRLRAAGAVIVGKTNMTEFAFSGVGINPHYGTPGNPWDRARIPGGSSSGAAVAAADGMVQIAIGSDTGGSTRIPAAVCGIVGWKPTQARVPRDGAFPLSPTLDTVGPLAHTVADCALADAVMAGEAPVALPTRTVAGLRLGMLGGRALETLDAHVAADFERACQALSAAGARISEVRTSLINDMLDVIATSNFPGIEANAALAGDLASKGEMFDQIVRARLTLARGFPASDYITMVQRRTALVAAFEAFSAPFDALILPTVPIIAPKIADLGTMEAFTAANMALLRNTAIGNFFDRPAISLPMHRPGSAPTGLMLFGRRFQDRDLFAIAAAIEPLAAGR